MTGEKGKPPDKEPDKPPEDAGPLQRYRFRVRTADGRELVSHIASVRVPPAPAPAPLQALPVEAMQVIAPLVQMQPAAEPKSWIPVRILVSVQGRHGAFKPDPPSPALHGHQFESIEMEFTLGKPAPGLVRLVREIGPSTPQLWNAIATNETLASVLFSIYGTEAKGPGAEVEFFTMKLTNAHIASSELVMPNNKHPDLMKYREYQELQFAYEAVDWAWKDGASVHSDFASSPK